MGAVRDAFAIPGVRLVELGWACSVIGELSGTIALAVYAFHQGGAALVGVYGIARTLPAAVVAPVIMGLSDRVRRELLLRLATGIRALLLGGAAVAAAAHGPAVVVIALAAASSVLASTYRPLLIAIVPWLVRSPAELGAVNVLATTMESSGALAGPVVAAVLLAAGPTWLAVGVASGFLAAATLLLWPVRLYQQHPDRGHARGSALASLSGDWPRLARVAPPAGMAVLAVRADVRQGSTVGLAGGAGLGRSRGGGYPPWDGCTRRWARVAWPERRLPRLWYGPAGSGVPSSQACCCGAFRLRCWRPLSVPLPALRLWPWSAPGTRSRTSAAGR